MRLLPREDKFFDYFRQQTTFIRQAADLLLEGVEGGSAHLASVITMYSTSCGNGVMVISMVATACGSEEINCSGWTIRSQ